MNINFNSYNPSFGARAPYGWHKPSSVKHTETVKRSPSRNNLDDMGTVPLKYSSEVVLAFDTPEALAKYVKKLDNRVKAYESTNGGYDPEIDASKDIVEDIISFIDCKIDFQRLGINSKSLSKDELIDYGSQFAFWTTNLNGKPRNNRERPAAVRSTNEYIKLVQDRYPICAAAEFENLIERLPSDVLKQDRKMQDGYDAEYQKAHYDYRTLPFSQRIMTFEPKRKYTPIYGKVELLRKLRAEIVDDSKSAQQKARHEKWLQERMDDIV